MESKESRTSERSGEEGRMAAGSVQPTAADQSFSSAPAKGKPLPVVGKSTTIVPRATKFSEPLKPSYMNLPLAKRKSKKKDQGLSVDEQEKETSMCLLDKSKVNQFISDTFAQGVKGLTDEFLSMKRSIIPPLWLAEGGLQKALANATDPEQINEIQFFIDNFDEFFKANRAGKNQNRYRDVGCISNSRVILRPPWPEPYIHANFVPTAVSNKRMICTQGPTSDTVSRKRVADFWFMCLQESVQVIVMLCMYVENGMTKCADYIPPPKKAYTFSSGDKKITVKLEKHLLPPVANSSIVIQKNKYNVKLEGTDKSMSRSITHYYWMHWPG
ncbi:hypothetical protein WR25_00340 [Diploscapter pachys]|uniref:Tyrosine-protein phosphatase domain-containing protein n=1 Tax=Diploscapter pachys TaxID=2018661 RepID=A0A2A2L6R0_9BILA|nr:hypothetical protein WR25_00340 [Diploscapter pachys]